MALTQQEVEHVAGLARLGLDAAETERMREQLSSILGHIDVLREVDTSAISPTAQVNDVFNVWREDEVRPSLDRDQVLANAPRHSSGFFEVDTPLGGTGAES